MQIGVYSMSEQEEKAKNWETWQRHKEISQHLATLEREIRDTGQLLVDVGFCMKEISASSGKIKLAEGQICITTPGNNRSRLQLTRLVFLRKDLWVCSSTIPKL